VSVDAALRRWRRAEDLVGTAWGRLELSAATADRSWDEWDALWEAHADAVGQARRARLAVVAEYENAGMGRAAQLVAKLMSGGGCALSADELHFHRGGTDV
jgi:hypothetical protein